MEEKLKLIEKMEEKLKLIEIINLLMDEINNNGVVLSDTTQEIITNYLKEGKAVLNGCR